MSTGSKIYTIRTLTAAASIRPGIRRLSVYDHLQIFSKKQRDHVYSNNDNDASSSTCNKA